MSSWTDWFTCKVEDWSAQLLSHGPIPRHVAFVMDGNRRYAQKLGLEVGQGHYHGFSKLEQMLELCMKLGVEVVTVYAFSIENFKRPTQEVDFLMRLAKEKLTLFCQESELVRDYDVRIQVLGDLSLLSPDVFEAIQLAMSMTAEHRGPTLNVCFPYTSQHEMCTAVNKVYQAVKEERLQSRDVDENVIETYLMTAGCPDLDLLVRTSGEVRLSDFLLWQATTPGCQIHFIDVYWPEFSKYQLLQILLSYQLNYARLQRERESWKREHTKQNIAQS